MKHKILQEAQNAIGTDVSPVYDELGCAESVNTIVERATGTPVGGGASTYRMYKSLTRDNKWRMVGNPTGGDLIISPTGYGDRTKVSNGHVGIFLDSYRIASNDSYALTWEQNYTLDEWYDRYQRKGEYPVYFFRRKETAADRMRQKLKAIQRRINQLWILLRKIKLMRS